MRTYEIKNGTLHMKKYKPFMNHKVEMMRPAYYAHISRKPECMLKAIGIAWTYLGLDFGAKQ